MPATPANTPAYIKKLRRDASHEFSVGVYLLKSAIINLREAREREIGGDWEERWGEYVLTVDDEDLVALEGELRELANAAKVKPGAATGEIFCSPHRANRMLGSLTHQRRESIKARRAYSHKQREKKLYKTKLTVDEKAIILSLFKEADVKARKQGDKFNVTEFAKGLVKQIRDRTLLPQRRRSDPVGLTTVKDIWTYHIKPKP